MLDGICYSSGLTVLVSFQHVKLLAQKDSQVGCCKRNEEVFTNETKNVRSKIIKNWVNTIVSWKPMIALSKFLIVKEYKLIVA